MKLCKQINEEVEFAMSSILQSRQSAASYPNTHANMETRTKQTQTRSPTYGAQPFNKLLNRTYRYSLNFVIEKEIGVPG